MKKLQRFLLLLLMFINIGCGGGSSSSDIPTHTPKAGYWEVQDAVTKNSIYKGFLIPHVYMLDQDNLSWEASFHYSYISILDSYDTITPSVKDINYTFTTFNPIDSSQSTTSPEFSMNDEGTESSITTLYGNSVKLIFDPAGIHNSVNITPSKFSNLVWKDQRDTQNTFVTTDSVFTIVSNLTALEGGNCTFNGTLPTTTVNYASVEVSYSCTTGATGTTYIDMTSNENLTQMIAGIHGDANLQGHTILFK